MSYSSRVRYKTRREKNKIAARNFRVFILFIILAAVIYGLMNRVEIYDYIRTSMY